MNIKIDIVQTSVRFGDPSVNIANMEHAITDRVSSNSIIIMPELWTCSYDLDNMEKHASYYNEIMAFLTETARENASWIIGGSIPVFESGKLYNRCLVIDDAGNFVGKYDKCHLVPGLDRKFSKGQSPFLFEMGGAKCACVICYDIRFPEYIRALALSGIDVLFVPSAWSKFRISHWEILLQARAIENEFFVVGANQCGSSGSQIYGGTSMAVSPLGQVLARIGEEPGIIEISINPEETAKARKIFPVFEGRNRSLYQPVILL